MPQIPQMSRPGEGDPFAPEDPIHRLIAMLNRERQMAGLFNGPPPASYRQAIRDTNPGLALNHAALTSGGTPEWALSMARSRGRNPDYSLIAAGDDRRDDAQYLRNQAILDNLKQFSQQPISPLDFLYRGVK